MTWEIVETPVDADVVDIPWLLALDSLKEQGYTIETVSFAAEYESF